MTPNTPTWLIFVVYALLPPVIIFALPVSAAAGGTHQHCRRHHGAYVTTQTWPVYGPTHIATSSQALQLQVKVPPLPPKVLFRYAPTFNLYGELLLQIWLALFFKGLTPNL
jgi:hypothetical protein